MDFSDLSKRLTRTISKTNKQTEGIYFTSPNTIKHNMDILKKYLKNADTILEPSCGSGEYFPQLREMFPTAIITGIEKNNTIYDDVK